MQSLDHVAFHPSLTIPMPAKRTTQELRSTIFYNLLALTTDMRPSEVRRVASELEGGWKATMERRQSGYQLLAGSQPCAQRREAAREEPVQICPIDVQSFSNGSSGGSRLE